MISVLCPSRNRTELLAQSIRSLQSTAKGDVEYLVAADPDDTDTAIIAQDLGARVWQPERRYGYYYFHQYVNALAALASGSHLLLWNDDAVMYSDGWDSRIARLPNYVVQTLSYGTGSLFPAVPTAWVHHLGHFALERHCDSWWDEVGRRLGRVKRLRLAGHHSNPDDQTSEDARGKKKNPEFYGDANMALIQADVDKIKELL